MPGLPGKLANPSDLTTQRAQASARNTMTGKAAELSNQMGGSSQRTIIQPPRATDYGKISDLSGGKMPTPKIAAAGKTTVLQTAAKRRLRTPTDPNASYPKMAKLANKRRKRSL